jgi:hypothetical protein
MAPTYLCSKVRGGCSMTARLAVCCCALLREASCARARSAGTSRLARRRVLPSASLPVMPWTVKPAADH